MEDSAQMMWTWIDNVGIKGGKPWHLPPPSPSNVWHPNMQCPVAKSDGTMSGVSVSLAIRKKGRLVKSREDICWGASRFLWWNSNTSYFDPQTSSAGLHLFSLMLYLFQHTRYLSFPWSLWLSGICSTWYPSTPLHITGGGRSFWMHSVMVSALYGLNRVTEKTIWIFPKDEGSLGL